MPLNNPEEILTSRVLVAPGPLDGKRVVADLTERDAIPTIQRYHMMKVAVQSEAKEYQLLNAGDLTNTGWTVAGGGGGGSPGGTVTGAIQLRNATGDGFNASDKLRWTTQDNLLISGSIAEADATVTDNVIFGSAVSVSGTSKYNWLIGDTNTIQDTGALFYNNYFFGKDYIVHAAAGQIYNNFMFGDNIQILGGTHQNVTVFGENINVNDTANRGFYNGYNIDVDGFGWIMGWSSGGEPNVAVSNIGWNFSGNNGSYDTNQTPGHGMHSRWSGIFAGINHDIPDGALRCVILGGQAIKVAVTDQDTVYMPKLKIGQGFGGALPTTGETHNLAINSATGEVIQTALGGGGGSPGGTVTGALQLRNAAGNGFDADDRVRVDQGFPTAPRLFVDDDSNRRTTLQGNFLSVQNTLTGQGGLIEISGTAGSLRLINDSNQTKTQLWGGIASRNYIESVVGLAVGVNAAATNSSGVILDVLGSSSMTIPKGNTANRPSTGITSMLRFNTDLSTFEGYDGTSWLDLAGGTPAGADTQIQFNNAGAFGASSLFKILSNTFIQAGADANQRSLIGDGLVALYNSLNSNTVNLGGASSGLLQVNTNTGGSAISIDGNPTANSAIRCFGTNSIELPVGTAVQRPSTLRRGMLRCNSDTNKLEFYNGAGWETITST